MTYLLGILEDNVGLLTLSCLGRRYGFGHFSHLNFPFGYEYTISNSNQPFFDNFFFFFSRGVDEILVYNSFLILGIALTFLAGLNFFRYFLKSRKLAFLCSVLFIMSPYFFIGLKAISI